MAAYAERVALTPGFRWATFGVSLAFVVCAVALLWTWIPPAYDTNDDVTIRRVLEGTRVPGQPPTGFALLPHAALGWVACRHSPRLAFGICVGHRRYGNSGVGHGGVPVTGDRLVRLELAGAAAIRRRCDRDAKISGLDSKRLDDAGTCLSGDAGALQRRAGTGVLRSNPGPLDIPGLRLRRCAALVDVRSRQLAGAIERGLARVAWNGDQPHGYEREHRERIDEVVERLPQSDHDRRSRACRRSSGCEPARSAAPAARGPCVYGGWRCECHRAESAARH